LEIGGEYSVGLRLQGRVVDVALRIHEPFQQAVERGVPGRIRRGRGGARRSRGERAAATDAQKQREHPYPPSHWRSSGVDGRAQETKRRRTDSKHARMKGDVPGKT
jgi:hypothetical protein